MTLPTFKTAPQVVGSTAIWGTIGLLTPFLIQSFWINILLGLIIFLVSRLFLSFFESQQSENNPNSSQLLIENYAKFKKWTIFSISICTTYVVTLLIMDQPPNLFILKLLYFPFLIFLCFYAPILICHFLYYIYLYKIELPHHLESNLETNDITPLTLQVQSRELETEILNSTLQSEYKFEPHSFLQQLNDYYKNTSTELSNSHHNHILHIMNIFQKIKNFSEQQRLGLATNDKLNAIQQNTIQQIKQSIEAYILYSPKQRKSYNTEIKTLPDLQLNKQLKQYTEQLIQEVAFLSTLNLQSSIDQKNDQTQSTHIRPQKANTDLEIASDDFIQQLNNYIHEIFYNIPRKHILIIKHIIEIFKEIEKFCQKKETHFNEKNRLKSTQKTCFMHIQQSIDTYFTYFPKQLHYDTTLKTTPDLWLSQQLKQHTEQLIQEVVFIYDQNLQALLDHQIFLAQEFNDKDDYFQVITQDHPHKN